MNVAINYSTYHLQHQVGGNSVKDDMMKTSCEFVFKWFYNLGPGSFNTMFNLYIPQKEARSAEKFFTPIRNGHIEFGEKSLVDNGYDILDCSTIGTECMQQH